MKALKLVQKYSTNPPVTPPVSPIQPVTPLSTSPIEPTSTSSLIASSPPPNTRRIQGQTFEPMPAAGWFRADMGCILQRVYMEFQRAAEKTGTLEEFRNVVRKQVEANKGTTNEDRWKIMQAVFYNETWKLDTTCTSFMSYVARISGQLVREMAERGEREKPGRLKEVKGQYPSRIPFGRHTRR